MNPFLFNIVFNSTLLIISMKSILAGSKEWSPVRGQIMSERKIIKTILHKKNSVEGIETLDTNVLRKIVKNN